MKKQILLIGIIFSLAVLISSCSRKSEQVLNQEAEKALDAKNYKEAVNVYNHLLIAYSKSPDAPKA